MTTLGRGRQAGRGGNHEYTHSPRRGEEARGLWLSIPPPLYCGRPCRQSKKEHRMVTTHSSSPSLRRLLAVALLLAGAVPARTAEPEQAPVFVSGRDGYHTYRIPSLLVTAKGTLLAFCEGRKTGRGDAGDIDLLLRRSRDGGKTWEKTQVVWDDGDNTCGNPCPVLGARTGTIWLLLTHNLGRDTEATIVTGKSKGTRTVWVSRSDDARATSTRPVATARAER